MSPFTITRRVEFGDTDMAGIMHFANYFRFMEVAETDFLHSLGMSVSWRQKARNGASRAWLRRANSRSQPDSRTSYPLRFRLRRSGINR